MEKSKKYGRKSLIVGVIAAVVILALALVLVLVKCNGTQTNSEDTEPVVQTVPETDQDYRLFWNVDRKLYDGKSEAGLSSRKKEADGYYHIRFLFEGQPIELLTTDVRVVNAIDILDVMGLEFDDKGLITAVVNPKDMPLQRVGWSFYVQSVGGKVLKLNSSAAMDGVEALLEITGKTKIYDMTGVSGNVGIQGEPIQMDRVYAVADLTGELTHVFIYDRSNYMNTHEALCQHCKETVTWKEWVKADSLPNTSGHYVLMNDVDIKGGQTQMREDAEICLDLNGMTVTKATGGRMIAMFSMGNKLAIMDSSKEGKGTIKASGKGDQGLCVWVRYGEFHLYGGILDASEAQTMVYGAAVATQANTYMYMHGGEIIGGTAMYRYNEETKAYTHGYGGTMGICGKLVINGGVIRDGQAATAITWDSKGQPVYNRGVAGNIFACSGSEIILNGGTIKNGIAGNIGGNLYLDGTSTFTMNGGSIEGGMITGKGKNGGSIVVTNKAVFTMNGGSIAGGLACNAGANLYLNGTFIMNGGYIGGGTILDWNTRKVRPEHVSRNVFVVNGTFGMYGGKIDGGFTAIDSKDDGKDTLVALSGMITLDAGEGTTGNMTLSVGAGGPVKVVVGKLIAQAKVRVNVAYGVFTDPTDAANREHFVSEIPGVDVLHHNGCLAVGKVGCLCGHEKHIGSCDGTQLMWLPHSSSTSLPITSGYWFLTSDVRLTGQQSIRGLQDIKLDLNGKTVTTAEGARGYAVFDEKEPSTLTITDSSTQKTGTLRAVGEGVTVEGQCIWLRTAGQTVNLYGGTLDASQTVSTRRGTAIYANAGTTVNLYDGTIRGGTAQAWWNETTKAIQNGSGGSVYTAGIFNMYGGTITGGRALSCLNKAKDDGSYAGGLGGNLSAAHNATVNLLGGTIANGVAHAGGGNIYLDGTQNVVIRGVRILNGTTGSAERKMAGSGGNIFTSGTLTIDGQTQVSGGVGSYDTNGGNIAVSATGALTVNSGVIEKGTAERGGNINTFGDLTVNGGTISGGTAGSGGNILAYGKDVQVAISGGELKKGTATTGNGGNIYLYAGALNITAGSILEGTASNGGGISTQDGTVTISGGTISGGTAVNGGSIYIRTSTVTVTGGTISGGTATGSGGNIYLLSGTCTLAEDGNAATQPQILGGTMNNTASGDGGNVFVNGGAAFRMECGKVANGRVLRDSGANIHVRGTFQMTGGLVTGGERVTADGTVHPSSNSKRNLFVYRASMEMHGGQIDGGVQIYDNKANQTSILLSGDARIVSPDHRASLTSDVVLQIAPAGLATTADIHLSGFGVDKVFGISQNGSALDSGLKQVFDGGTGTQVTLESNQLFLRSTSAHVHCLCGRTNGTHAPGCDGSDRVFQAWSTTNALPTEGYYYLELEAGKQVELTGQHWVGRQNEPVKNLHLCLNGKTVTNTTSNVTRLITVWTGSHLDVTDCGTGGTLKATSSIKGGGGVVNLAGSLTLYNGTINGSSINTTANGPVISGSGGLAIHGGTILGGKTTANGGAVYGGNVTMTGGSISGGRAASGGNVYLSAGTFVMTGGSISGGQATVNGGNVMVNSGSFQMQEDGNAATQPKIQDGTMTSTASGDGGNVYVNGGTVFEMHCGKIENGKIARDGGANLCVRGTLTMTNGLITGGERVVLPAGTVHPSSNNKRNIFLFDGALNMSGGQIDGGVEAYRNATVKVSGDAKIVSNEKGRGSLKLGSGIVITVGKDGLGTNAAVRITGAVAGTAYAAAETGSALIPGVEGCFTCDEGLTAYLDNGQIRFQ